MRIHRIAKILLLAPPIGSALIGVLGLVVGIALIAGRGHFANRTIAKTEAVAPRTSPNGPVATLQAATPAGAGAVQNVQELNTPRLGGAAVVRRRATLFQKPIASNQLVFLHDYAGRPAGDVVHEKELRNLVNRIVPYAPFHLGLDVPLPHAVESMFSTSTLPVVVRQGRYVIVTGVRGANARGRALLWIDLQEGIALGGIFFYPSNGEPTPTLTIFSSQVNRQSLRMSQLPAAFVQDLSVWAAAEGLPPVTTRYFINASSEKSVLAHDENFCKGTGSLPALPLSGCKEMKVEAAHIDMEASNFLKQTNYATNATMRMIPAKADGAAAQ